MRRPYQSMPIVGAIMICLISIVSVSVIGLTSIKVAGGELPWDRHFPRRD